MILNKVKYCTECVVPNSSAIHLELDNNGVCTACTVNKQRDVVNWDERKNQFLNLLDKYSAKGKGYDCIIPVSGGKDSYWQVHLIKNVCGANPLLVTYNANNWTETGYENLHNMRNVFGCDHIFFTPSIDILKKLNRICLKKMGDISWHAHCGIFTYPFQVAVKEKIPLVMYGEHGYTELGGMHGYDDFIEHTSRFRHEHTLRGFEWYDMMNDETDPIKEHELLWAKFPSDDDMIDVGVRGIFMGNYFKWDPNETTKLMIEKFGFKVNPTKFDRTYRTMSNLDDMHENGVHDYLKYIKFGYGRCTDHVCKDIRAGKMTRAEGVELVRQYDHVKPSDLKRWLEYVKMSEAEFDAIADTFRSDKVWSKINGKWEKDNLWD